MVRYYLFHHHQQQKQQNHQNKLWSKFFCICILQTWNIFCCPSWFWAHFVCSPIASKHLNQKYPEITQVGGKSSLLVGVTDTSSACTVQFNLDSLKIDPKWESNLLIFNLKKILDILMLGVPDYQFFCQCDCSLQAEIASLCSAIFCPS